MEEASTIHNLRVELSCIGVNKRLSPSVLQYRIPSTPATCWLAAVKPASPVTRALPAIGAGGAVLFSLALPVAASPSDMAALSSLHLGVGSPAVRGVGRHRGLRAFLLPGDTVHCGTGGWLPLFPPGNTLPVPIPLAPTRSAPDCSRWHRRCLRRQRRRRCFLERIRPGFPESAEADAALELAEVIKLPFATRLPPNWWESCGSHQGYSHAAAAQGFQFPTGVDHLGRSLREAGSPPPALASL